MPDLLNHYDFIFSLFGIEDIPHEVKLDKFEIRDNKDYQLKYKYFNNFFNNLKSVSKNETLFCPLLRITNLQCLMAFLDAGTNNHWILKDNKIDFIDSNSARIPFFVLKYITSTKKVDMINLDSFFKITKKYRNEDSLRHVFTYDKNKPYFTDLIKKDKIYYKDDQNTLYYKIYKKLPNYMMFMWATNGFCNYQECNNQEKLKKSFFELTSEQLNL